MRKAIQTFKTKAACTAARAGAILRDEAGDFYISDGVKIIIAVVLGALLLAALTTLYVVQMVRAAKKRGVTSGLEDFEGFLPKQFFPILGMVVLYLVIMYFAGFYIATLVFMAACLLFLKVPKWQILLSTAVILVLVYCAFTLFLKVKLPMGLLFK